MAAEIQAFCVEVHDDDAQFLDRTAKPGRIRLPGLVYLIEIGDARILYDTGAGQYVRDNPQLLKDRLGQDVTVDFKGYPSVLDHLERLQASITHLVLSHGHFDHAGCARALIDRYHPAIFIHKKELEVMRLSPERRDAVYFQEDTDGLEGVSGCEYGLDMLGNGEVFTLDLAGHTPGHMGLLLPNAKCVLVGDAFYTDANLEGNLPSPRLVSDEEDYIRSLGCIRELRAEGYTILRDHEPGFLRG